MNKKLSPLFQSDQDQFVYENDQKAKARRSYKGLYSRNKSSMQFVKLIYEWKKIVSPVLSEHTIPLKLKGTTLYILLTHSVFGQELMSEQIKIIKKLEKSLSMFKGKIKRFKFIISEKKLSELMKKSSLSPSKEKKKKTTEEDEEISYNPFNPEYIHWKNYFQQHFNHQDDPELEKLMLNLFLQTKMGKKH